MDDSGEGLPTCRTCHRPTPAYYLDSQGQCHDCAAPQEQAMPERTRDLIPSAYAAPSDVKAWSKALEHKAMIENQLGLSLDDYLRDGLTTHPQPAQDRRANLPK